MGMFDSGHSDTSAAQEAVAQAGCGIAAMAIIADSGAIYGIYDRRDADHASIRAAIEKARDLIILPAF
jgi:hypothetical protein